MANLYLIKVSYQSSLSHLMPCNSPSNKVCSLYTHICVHTHIYWHTPSPHLIRANRIKLLGGRWPIELMYLCVGWKVEVFEIYHLSTIAWMHMISTVISGGYLRGLFTLNWIRVKLNYRHLIAKWLSDHCLEWSLGLGVYQHIQTTHQVNNWHPL